MELTFRCRVQEQALEQEIEQLQTTLERMAEYRVSEYPLSSPLLAPSHLPHLQSQLTTPPAFTAGRHRVVLDSRQADHSKGLITASEADGEGQG